MEEKYKERNRNYKLGSEQLIEFEAEKIEPGIPTDDTILNGWTITPVTEPAQVSRNEGHSETLSLLNINWHRLRKSMLTTTSQER